MDSNWLIGAKIIWNKRNKSNMLSNAYPIIVETPEVSMRSFNYSDDRLSELRSAHNTTHSFFRLDDHIMSLWNSGNDITGGEPVIVNADESPESIDRMIRHLCFRTLVRELPGLRPLTFYPIRIVSRHKSHDALKNYLPTELQGVVCFNLLIEISIRRVFHRGKVIPHLVIGMHRSWLIKRNLAELHAEGFTLVGVPVVHVEPVPGLETVLAPTESAIGRVMSISGNVAEIQTFEGVKSFPLQELALRKSRTEISDYLSFKLGKNEARKTIETVFSVDSLSSNAEELHKEIEEIARYFCGWKFTTKTGFSFRVEKASRVAAPSLDLEETRFLFDVTPGSGATSPFSGLSRFGPYDSAAFRPKEPRILVVCQQSNRGGFSKAAAAFEKGLPGSKYFQKGFKDLFHLRDVHWDIAEAKGPTPQHFCEAIREKIGSGEYDLVIVEGDESQKALPSEQNSFIMSKALLLGMGIPVQGLKHENVRKSGDFLGTVLGPMALQIYAKLGGVPWTLPASPDVDRELIVGIGSAESRDTEFTGGNVRRVVAMTTFFANDGRFLMASTCKAVPYEAYFEELLRSLENSIKTLSAENAWVKGDTVRVIFHIFKPIKHIEADVVAELMQRFPDYDVKFAFVTVSTKHPFLLFDDGFRARENQKGHFVPLRGTNVQLSELECLIQLRGRNEMKASRQGFSRPALVRIHEKSTFKDLHHIVEQVKNFTHLSWKTFFATSLPVSIYYADEIAKWLDRLERLPGWNPEIINTALKRKKWFL
jgi:hypothetical protein